MWALCNLKFLEIQPFFWGLDGRCWDHGKFRWKYSNKKNFWFTTESIAIYSEENIQSTVVESEKVIWRFCLWDVWIDVANGDRRSRIPCQIQIGWIGCDGYGSRQPSWFHVNIFLLQGGTSGTPTTLLDESFAWRVGWLDLIDGTEGFWVSTCHWTDRLKLCNDDVPKLLALLQTIHVLHVMIYWRVVGQSLRDVNLFFCDNWVRKWVRKTVRHKTNWFPKDLFSFSPCYFHYAKIGVSNAGILSQKWAIFQEFVGNAILTGQIKCRRHFNWANWCWRLAIFVSWDTVNGKNPASTVPFTSWHQQHSGIRAVERTLLDSKMQKTLQVVKSGALFLRFAVVNWSLGRVKPC